MASTLQEATMKTIALLLLLLPLTSHSQMRCPDGSYRTTCDGGQAVGGGGVSSYSAPAPTPPIQFNRDSSERYRSAGETTRRNEAVRAPQSTRDRAAEAGLSRNDLVRARNRGELLVGMSRQDVDHIMGRPDDVRTYVSSSRRCDDLWYRDRSRGWHTRVTMCDGKLQSYGADSR